MLNSSSKKTTVTHYKYLTFLAMLYCTILCVTHVLTYRIVIIKGILISGGSFTIPLCYVLADIIVEIYGYKISRQIIWLAIACLLIFAVLATLIINLPFPDLWHQAQAYNIVLGHIIKLSLATTAGLCISSFANVYLLSKWKIFIKGKLFWIRSLGSTALGEAIFIIVMIPISFYGHSINTMLRIAAASYAIKIIYNLTTIGPASFFVFILKKKEGADVYDYDTNFNPFSLELD